MLAPLRDHFAPRDPRASPLLCTTRDQYSSRLRLPGYLESDNPMFKESQWITSEDVNVEHLVNIFTSFDTDSNDTWETCANLLMHLYWHKSRSTVLGPKIEGLSDDHHSKPRCLFWFSLSFRSIGNHVEAKRLLSHTLELQRGQGINDGVARTLWRLAQTNRMLDLYEEGIQRSKEALEIYQRVGDAMGQGLCWNCLAELLLDDSQLDAAEEAGSHAIKIFLDQGRDLWVCDTYRLGNVYRSKGERGKAIQHFEVAVGIAYTFGWKTQLFWVHYSLAELHRDENDFDNAQSRIEQTKLHAVDHAHRLGLAVGLQASIWYRQGRLKEAKAEVSCALEMFEKLGATRDLEKCKDLLQWIELAAESSYVSGDSDDSAYGTPPSTPASTDHASG